MTVSAIRLYSRLSPLQRGKSRLEIRGGRLLAGTTVLGQSRHGVRFELRFPEDRGWECVYFRGEHEAGTTVVVQSLLDSDSVFLDIGANMGWYTTHAAAITVHGHCHAFEPSPTIFSRLQRNCALNGIVGRVTLNQLALGKNNETVAHYSFAGLPHGHGSTSDLGRTDFTTVPVEAVTLDRYAASHQLARIDLIKMDVEGAELSVLQGAESVLGMASPPAWIIEMNEETAAEFGHAPSDLLTYLQDHGEYEFFVLGQGGWETATPLASPDAVTHGDNILCVPPARQEAVRRRL